VLLSEPPRSPYDLHFRVLGIPVRVHPFFWLVALLFGLGGNQEPVAMLYWVGAVFVSILVHELGHALTARSYGWEPSITLHGFGGLASYRPTYHSTASQVLITLAGPGAGFLFAALIAALIAASGHHVTFDWHFGSLLPIRFEPFQSDKVNLLVLDLLFINIFWGLVNLLPVYPLDGGQIAREMLELASPQDGVRQSLWMSVITAAIVAVLAYTKLHDMYIAIFFAYMAYTNYRTLQAYFGPGGGMGRFR
jgi:membrane-associated protease RseP (regulator of RpoE activity)